MDYQIVSLGNDGQAVNADSYRGVSDNGGRYVLFDTRATNVTDNGENFRPDYFVRDTVTGTTTQVSATSSGSQSKGTPSGGDVSGNGKLVVFSSAANDLTADDTDRSGDVFLFNMDGGSLTRISPDMIGIHEVRFATNAVISGDGRYVAYVAGTATRTEFGVTDTVTTSSIILYDTVTKTTEFVSQPKTSNAEFADSRSDSPQISEDGRYVMFTSTAGHIHAAAGETVTDRYVTSDAIFLHDRSADSTELIFKYNTEFNVLGQAKYLYQDPVMSGDGSKIVLYRYVARVGFDKPKGTTELVLFDVNTKTVTLIDSGKELTNRTVANAFAFDISDDGRYVAFTSGYNPDGSDVRHNFDWLYVYDVQSGQTRLVTSQEVDGTVDSLLVVHPFISGDGSKVGFSTSAEFVASDANPRTDVFLTSNPFLIQNTIQGTNNNETLNGSNGNDNVNGIGGNDTIIALGGDDRLTGGNGNDSLDGGGGEDTALFSGLRSDYTIFNTTAGTVVFDVKSGRDGKDIITNVENIQFADQTVTLAEALTAPTDADGSAYEVYRFFSSVTGSHFFTTSSSERNSLIQNSEIFTYEGNTFDSNATADNGGTAVFRFYNTESSVHFYTASAEEAANIRANLPHFNDEGIAYYAHTSADAGGTALFRFFNTQNGSHFYTSSETERDNIINTLGHFNYEGTAYYVDVA